MKRVRKLFNNEKRYKEVNNLIKRVKEYTVKNYKLREENSELSKRNKMLINSNKNYDKINCVAIKITWALCLVNILNILYYVLV